MIRWQVKGYVKAGLPTGGVMQNHSGACSPEKLGSLQRIFEAIWLELESKHSKHTFPWNVQASRFRIAHYLLDHVNETILDADRVKRDVLLRMEQGESR
jgi:hypothetical protein